MEINATKPSTPMTPTHHSTAATVPALSVISSMATRQVLASLCDEYSRRTGRLVALESVGGVDAAKRVRSGERFDLVVLAADAIDALVREGHLSSEGVTPILRSPVALGVKADAPAPPLDDEAAVRRAVCDAESIGYSTGPSGTRLVALIEAWGLRESVGPKLLQSPPGVPVAAMLARGQVALGFQQLSELMDVEGVRVVGTLPDPIAIVTTFTGAVGATGPRMAEARQLLLELASPAGASVKHRFGMLQA
jgi:molybdate transport system substrate-binding protein